MLDHFRNEALLQLSGHPYSVALVMAIKEPTAVQQSTDRPLASRFEEAEEEEEPEPARSSAKGRGEPR